MNFREVTEKLVQDPVGMAHHVEWNRFDAEDIECVLRKNPQVLDVVDWSMVRGPALASLLKGPFAQEVRKASGYNHVMRLRIGGYGYGVSTRDLTEERIDELARDTGQWLSDWPEVFYLQGLAMDDAVLAADSIVICQGDDVLCQGDGDSPCEMRLVEDARSKWFYPDPPQSFNCQPEAELGVCVVEEVKTAFDFDVATKTVGRPSCFVIHYIPKEMPSGAVVNEVRSVECEDKEYSIGSMFKCDTNDKGPDPYLRFKPIHGPEIFKGEIIRSGLRIVAKNKSAALAAISLLNNENSDFFIDDYIGHFVVESETQDNEIFAFDLVGFSSMSGRELVFNDVLGLWEDANIKRGDAHAISLNRFCRLNDVGIELMSLNPWGWKESLNRLRTDKRYARILDRVAESMAKESGECSGCNIKGVNSQEDLALETVRRYVIFDQDQFVINKFGVASYLGCKTYGCRRHPFKGCKQRSEEFLPAKEIYAYPPANFQCNTHCTLNADKHIPVNNA